MRLALAMGRTVRELRETMDAEEWNKWLTFHALYDLPDGFLVAGQLGTVVSQAISGKGKPENFAPYYKLDAPEQAAIRRPPSSPSNLAGFHRFTKEYAGERKLAGKPIPSVKR